MDTTIKFVSNSGTMTLKGWLVIGRTKCDFMFGSSRITFEKSNMQATEGGWIVSLEI